MLSDNGSTLSYSPTFGYDLCSRRAANNKSITLDLSTWRAAGIGGDMIQPPVMASFAETFEVYGFKHTSFLASYGMAEATLAVSFAPLNKGLNLDLIDRRQLEIGQVAAVIANDDDTIDRRGFTFCGPPLPGHVIEIRGEDNAVLADRKIGRIFVNGPSVAPGYFGEPEATAETFRNGWLDTGDLGYMVNGEVVITGRSKDLMIINGRNIWPQDMEWAVETLPSLRRGDVAVFSIDDDDQIGPRVVILVQSRQQDAEAREQLRRDVKAITTRTAAVDGEIILVPPHSLPMTSSGKLSRARARQNYLDGHYTVTDVDEELVAAAGD